MARERYIKLLLMACASLSFLAILLIFIFILRESMPALTKVGFGNLFTSTDWNPDKGSFGILAFLNGTILTTLGGLIIGAPLGVGTAIFLDQVAPKKMATVIRRGIELLAGIPSVVIGWFGLIILVPFIARITNSSGYGIAAASVVLAVMVLPTITALSVETLRSLPIELKEASLAMGATRWQSIRTVLLPAAREGILVAVILGMGRAIGETMAVQMVIGNSRQFTLSLFKPTATLTSRLVTDMGEAPPGVFRSSLFAMALVLLIFAMLLIFSVRMITRKRKA
ncbi:MAG: phosphate ABC transporter permease subunit PstC [Candidatus Solincola sediminis]|uniref:Phosphate transport system permease protein n=1 Tax=Candidatus Solincola sediminis TaxID=1797199 RepID=A0A1F2WF90_9ACTN|nr:MAG: phosphate ABC transporter permease subunit PstC [Candidatus Solincola sediminis]OFW57807.1 MAG: phosphate ABC transporter permease subunit PstC [Candidatus Solincola sediminis]